MMILGAILVTNLIRKSFDLFRVPPYNVIHGVRPRGRKRSQFFFAVRKHQRLEIFGPNCKKRGPMMGDISGVLNVSDIKFIINGARPHSPKTTFSPC